MSESARGFKIRCGVVHQDFAGVAQHDPADCSGRIMKSGPFGRVCDFFPHGGNWRATIDEDSFRCGGDLGLVRGVHISVMQLGFGDFCEVLGGEIEHSRAKSQNGAPWRSRGSQRNQQAKQWFGKKCLIDLQGFSRHSPKRGQYATSKSPRWRQSHVRSVSGARRYRTRHARTRSLCARGGNEGLQKAAF
jgi:hypothetical protein